MARNQSLGDHNSLTPNHQMDEEQLILVNYLYLQEGGLFSRLLPTELLPRFLFASGLVILSAKTTAKVCSVGDGH